MASKPRLVIRAELHTLLGLTRARSYQVSAEKGFPDPYTYTEIDNRPLWRIEDVEEWDAKRKESRSS